jgi:hypothetical protein
MSSPDAAGSGHSEARARRALDEIREAARAGLSSEFIRDLLTCAVQTHANSEPSDHTVPALDPRVVTVTEVAVTVGPMLEAVRLELFELTMWRGLRSPNSETGLTKTEPST